MAKRLDARALGDARDCKRIFVLRIPPSAYLQCDRNIYRADHGIKYPAHQGLILQQSGTRHHVADFLRRTAHVNVDDLRALSDIIACGFSHHRRVRARDLHRDRIDFAFMIGAATRLFRSPQQRVARYHFGYRHAGTHALAQLPERAICHPRHGSDDKIVFENMGTDLHDLSLVEKLAAASWARTEQHNFNRKWQQLPEWARRSPHSILNSSGVSRFWVFQRGISLLGTISQGIA